MYNKLVVTKEPGWLVVEIQMTWAIVVVKGVLHWLVRHAKDMCSTSADD